MGISDRIRRGGLQRRSEVAKPSVPSPRSSPDARHRHDPTCPGPYPGTGGDSRLDFAHIYSRLGHVAVWTGGQSATFLLRTVDGRGYAVECDSPYGAHLLLYLGQLPGMDIVLLRELVGRPHRAPGVITLWPTDGSLLE